MKFGTVFLMSAISVSAISVSQAHDEEKDFSAEYEEYRANYQSEYVKHHGGTWEQFQKFGLECVDRMKVVPEVVKPVACQKPDPKKGEVNGYIAVTKYKNGNTIESINGFTFPEDVSKYIYVLECVDNKLKSLMVSNSCVPYYVGQPFPEEQFARDDLAKYVTSDRFSR